MVPILDDAWEGRFCEQCHHFGEELHVSSLKGGRESEELGVNAFGKWVGC